MGFLRNDYLLFLECQEFLIYIFWPEFFLLVDLRDFFFQIKGWGDRKKNWKKTSENDQLTGHFQSFFSFSGLFYIYIYPEQTVKLVKLVLTVSLSKYTDRT